VTNQIVPVDSVTDIFPAYAGTPVEWLLRYHNLSEPLPQRRGRAELLVGMCMDYRKGLVIPSEFAFVIRAAGGNLRDHEFDISFAIAVGGVASIAMLAHTDCGMVGVRQKRTAFIEGLVERGGWDAATAAAHFDQSAPLHDIEDPVSFVLEQSRRLRALYPGVLVAPLLYRVEDDRLLQIVEP
jgi:carbonic anhydrase